MNFIGNKHGWGFRLTTSDDVLWGIPFWNLKHTGVVTSESALQSRPYAHKQKHHMAVETVLS